MGVVIRDDDHVSNLREYRAILLGGVFVIVSAGEDVPQGVGLVMVCSNNGAWYEQVPW